MKLPKRIRVGYRWYKVITWKHLEADASQRFGECDKNQAIIRVDPKYGPTKTCNTLLHEVLHAVWHDRIGEKEAEEERVVTSFADGLCALARDNPEIVEAWLTVMRSDA